MDIYTVITIVGLVVAVIGGANTILEFCEKIHSYYQALLKKYKSQALEKAKFARPALQKKSEQSLAHARHPNNNASKCTYNMSSELKAQLESITLKTRRPAFLKTSLS